MPENLWKKTPGVWKLKVLDLTWVQNSMTKVIPNCSTPSKATPWKIASSLKNSRWRFHISDLPPNIYDPGRYSIMNCAAIFTVISNYCPCSGQTGGGVFFSKTLSIEIKQALLKKDGRYFGHWMRPSFYSQGENFIRLCAKWRPELSLSLKSSCPGKMWLNDASPKTALRALI